MLLFLTIYILNNCYLYIIFISRYFSVGGTVLAGGLAATGLGVVTGNNGLRDAGLTSALVGGGLAGFGTLCGRLCGKK